MSKTFFKEIDNCFDVSFSSTLFLFNRVSGCFLGQWEFKNTTNNVLLKIESKGFTKKSTNKPEKIQTRFSRFVLITFLGVVSREFKNTIKKKRGGRNLTLVLFWPLNHPLTTGAFL
jgi:hypothetical protein